MSENHQSEIEIQIAIERTRRRALQTIRKSDSRSNCRTNEFIIIRQLIELQEIQKRHDEHRLLNACVLSTRPRSICCTPDTHKHRSESITPAEIEVEWFAIGRDQMRAQTEFRIGN